MGHFSLKKLSDKDQYSLFKVNLFYFGVLLFVAGLNWYTCRVTVHDFEHRIESFKSGGEVICSNTFVSKQRGWSIDESKNIFIKADNFFNIKNCKEEN